MTKIYLIIRNKQKEYEINIKKNILYLHAKVSHKIITKSNYVNGDQGFTYKDFV